MRMRIKSRAELLAEADRMKQTESALAPLTGSAKIAHWNGEECQAATGTVVVGKSMRPTWWCAAMEGQRRKCVRVDYNGEVFYLDDEDGSGSHKVFETQGGPWCAGHKSLPVDDDASFSPNVPDELPAKEDVGN